jgi:PAS domain S-box-containing protein
MTGGSEIARIAAEQRARNARLTTSTLGGLTLLAAILTFAVHAPASVVAVLVIAAAVQAGAFLLVRSGRTMAGVLLSSAALYAEHLGVVAVLGALGPVPYLASLVVLLWAATADARWLPLGFVTCLVALGLEGWLAPWSPENRNDLMSAGLFAGTIFVVSLLHVRSTERAFAIAEKRDAERARAAAAAIESERRYRLIADATEDFITLVDTAGNALYLSPSHGRLLGLDVPSLLAQPIASALQVENTDVAEIAFRQALERGQARVELRVRRPDGSLRLLDSRMTRVLDDGKVLVAVISRDVTERRDLEQRLLVSERLEALGRLAGSVAHDFNNLLTVIGGSTELARAFLPANHPARADLESVMVATSSATDLARQLLTFSRKQVVVRTRIEIASVLEGQRELLTRLCGRDIRLEFDLEAGLPDVVMPRTHVEQLAMNLAVNARDAMASGGRLRFGLRRCVLGDRQIGDLVAGEYVEMDVADDGAGIPDDVLPHVFEPFFSTKGTRGTGLGLATCFGIVAQAGGTIDVASAVGKGTVFRIFLPAADANATTPGKRPTTPDVRRVLVVDDEPSVGGLTMRILQAEGYEVQVASNLAEARRILDDTSIGLDALLTDVMLGEERGTSLVEICRRIRPQARIVVMSGYAPDAGASEAVTKWGASFLAKPFRRDDLLRALRGEAS